MLCPLQIAMAILSLPAYPPQQPICIPGTIRTLRAGGRVSSLTHQGGIMLHLRG